MPVVLGTVELGFAAWRQAVAGAIDLTEAGVLFVAQPATTSTAAVSQPPTFAVGLPSDSRLLLLFGQTGTLMVTAAGAVLIASLVVEGRRPA